MDHPTDPTGTSRAPARRAASLTISRSRRPLQDAPLVHDAEPAARGPRATPVAATAINGRASGGRNEGKNHSVAPPGEQTNAMAAAGAPSKVRSAAGKDRQQQDVQEGEGRGEGAGAGGSGGGSDGRNEGFGRPAGVRSAVSLSRPPVVKSGGSFSRITAAERAPSSNRRSEPPLPALRRRAIMARSNGSALERKSEHVNGDSR